MANSLMLSNAEPPVSHEPIPGVQFRPITQEDLPAIGEAYWQTYVGTPEEMSLDEAAADVLAAWKGEYGRLLSWSSFGAWRDGLLAGAILTVSDPPWDDVPRGPFIIDLFVLPAYRRSGIGRALVQKVLMTEQVEVGLRVDDSATAARTLYEQLGFRFLRS
ncbi:GNAT family N-acetyltransferase [Arthrobacter sp. RCC_34]|uniref:GNAT family N-acetyltransferase n=1 Tax=Arthrobacter sp. RCC_34 TaxID=3239230 RepID=UPI003525FD81